MEIQHNRRGFERRLRKQMEKEELKTLEKKELLEMIDLILKEPKRYFIHNLVILQSLKYLINKFK